MIRPTIKNRRAFRRNLENAKSVVKTTIDPWNCKTSESASLEDMIADSLRSTSAECGEKWATYFHWNRPQMGSVVKPGMRPCCEDETEVLELCVPIPQFLAEGWLMLRRNRPDPTKRMPGTHIEESRDDKGNIKS
jgi:hypothetical protein